MDERIITLLEEIRDGQKESLANQQKVMHLYHRNQRRVLIPLVLLFVIVSAVIFLK